MTTDKDLGYDPDPEFEAMYSSEMAFREARGLLDDAAWDSYCETVAEDWLETRWASYEPEPDAESIPPPPTPPVVVQKAGVGPAPLQPRGPHQLTPIEAPFYDALAETGLTFSTQTWIQHADRRYRLDFLVHYDGRGVAVELDGHEYHKTKEQRSYDAARDRWLHARGIPVVRFTGSQVYADPQGCVRELLDVVRQSQARP